ncbi:MAG: hypothetical protein KTR16_03780 [Acidiferrobacterales bacterium]|nr:hypothetical protein [Acidiferrobacterales bacterium]
MNTLSNWHYPRPELADQYLNQIESGLSSNIVMFAERRAGKTEFVQQDLLPMAQERGLVTITIDFWSNQDNPIQAMHDGLLAAYERLSLKDSSKALMLKSGSATTGLIKVFEAGSTLGTVSIDTLAGVFNAFSIIMEKTGKKAIMHLDELQHLATDPSFEPAAAALRTFMDKNRGWLSSVMTGSSSDNLQRLFSRSKAPFYQSVEIEQFPKLKSEFVVHMLSCYETAVGAKLNKREAITAYKALGQKPEKFNALVKAMAKAKSTDFMGMWSVIGDSFDRRPTIEDDWSTLSDIEAGVAVMVLLMENGDHSVGLYSVGSFEFVAQYAGLEAGVKVSKSTVQNAIEKLRKMGWIWKAGHGKWKYEDPDAKSYVKEISGL